MRNEVIWLIRDTTNLNALEKVFLYTVETRGKDGLWTTHDQSAADMGFSKATFYRVRDSLCEKALLTVARRWNKPTVLHVNLEALQDMDSHTENSLSENPSTDTEMDSLSETMDSHTETMDSLSAETKKNLKLELEEEQDNAADAAPIDTKVDQQTVDSLFVGIVEESNIVKTNVEDGESSFVEIIGDDEMLSPRYRGDVAAAIAVVIGQERKLFGDPTPEDSKRYEAARALAMDCAWKPDVVDVGTRVGQAFAAVTPVGVDW